MARVWTVAIGMGTPDGWFGINIKSVPVGGGSKHNDRGGSVTAEADKQASDQDQKPAAEKHMSRVVSHDRRRKRPRR